MQLSADGGEATLLFAPETGQRARWPHLLSGGDVLFTLGDAGPDTGDLHVLIRDTGEHQLLVSTAAAGRVLDTGHLVFVRSGALWAVPFDLDRLDIVGSPVPVVEGVRVEAGGSIQYAIADNGVLVYIPGGFDTGQVQVAWVDRGGGEQRLPLPARNYWSLSLSPDGTRAAFGIRDQDNEDVWVGDLERGSLTRITSHAGVDRSPVWTADGRPITFASNRNSSWEVLSRSADGTGEPDVLATFDGVGGPLPFARSPDGSRLLVMVRGAAGRNIGSIAIDRPGTWEPLIQTEFDEGHPAIAPNGQWIAYTSNESGEYEVYVQRYPDLGDRRQVSLGGGIHPVWSADGRELLYGRGAPPDAMMRVTVEMAANDPSTLSLGTPEVLFEFNYRPSLDVRTYDESLDGQSLLMIEGVDGSSRFVEGTGRINVVLNWHQELLERVPIP